MKIKAHKTKGSQIAEIISDQILIRSAQDGL